MKRLLLIILVALSFASCEHIFEFSPYQANLADKYKGKTRENMARIIDQDAIGEPVVIIALADTHFDYGDLKDAIRCINKMDNIDFVVHLGDMTDRGLLLEYELFSKYMNDLKFPFITAIGNHDYLSNGGKIYKEMFDYYNYAFYYKGLKFVVFDATTFESKRRPDMIWFEKQISSDFMPKVILSHTPPWDRQYSSENRYQYVKVTNKNNVLLSMHGHNHSFYYGNKLNTELDFLVLSHIKDRDVCKLTIWPDQTYEYELVPF